MNNLMNNIKDFFVGTNKKLIILIILLLYCVLYISYLETQNKILITNPTTEIPKDYISIKNEVVNLEKKNKELTDALEYLKNKKDKVNYITKTETKLVGEKVVYKVLPQEYTFKLNKEIPVAKFSATDQYKFETYDLTYKIYTLISDKETLVKVTATSSFDNKEVPIDTINSVTYQSNQSKTKIFNPNLMVGISLNNKLETNPTIGISLVKTKNELLRFGLLETSFNKENIYLGLTPIQVNIGKPIPLISNLWIGTGYQTNFSNHFGNINLTAEL